MKVRVHFSLGCGGWEGYRTVKLPKYIENASEEKIRVWLQNWIDVHVPDFHHNLDGYEEID